MAALEDRVKVKMEAISKMQKLQQAREAVIRAAKEWAAMCWTPKERDQNLRGAVKRLEKLEGK